MDVRRLCWIVLVALGSTGRADATQPPPGSPAQPESTPPIAQRIAELGHRDLAVRWYAAYALGQRASDARDAVGPLRKRLDAVDEHEYVRAEAAWALIPAVYR